MLTSDYLVTAWEWVKRSSHCAGVDGITPELFQGIATEQLAQLRDQLLEDHYSPSPVLGFHVYRDRKAPRLVGIATVRDRIVQRYLLHSLTPTLDAVASPCSYAYRPGHSVLQAVAQLVDDHQGAPAWVLQADIHQFFDRLCWSLLSTDMEQLPLSAPMQHWVEQQIRMEMRLRGQPIIRTQGVIQGSALSGALANLYLSEFDRRCLAAGMKLVRYGDDLAIVCQSQQEAKQTLWQLQDWLNQRYLTLKPEKTCITAPGQELVFLGHRLRDGQVLETLKDWHPYRRRPSTRPPARQPRLPDRRPQQCSLVRSPVSPVSAPPNHVWSQPMTTLYITDQGASLRAEQWQFKVLYQGKLRCQLPVNQISQVLLFGCCSVTHAAARVALTRRIPIVYLSQRGRYYGRLETAGISEVTYLSQQVQKAADPEFCQQMAEALVLGKLHNSRILLMRLNRRHDSPIAAKAIADLAVLIDKTPAATSLDALRGYEGQAARVYFRGLASLFAEPFRFEQRTIRPPKDPVNSLLSLGYTLLHHNLYSFVQALGLHTHFGHLHTPRKDHPALVMDLTEEFRAPIVDSFVAYLINSHILKLEDFTPPDERGGVYLYPDALKVFLKHWEDRLHTEVTHPHTGQKVPYRRCLELQVREHIACLMGEQPLYRPMLWKL